MTPKQKRQRILEIEKDVQQIMMQLNRIEFKVETSLVPRRELPTLKIKAPSFLKKLWVGFITDMKGTSSSRTSSGDL